MLSGKVEELELSGNPMPAVPVVVGDMDLLKVLKEWEVGVACLKTLKSFSFSETGIKLYPPQIDRVAKLEALNMSNNELVKIPESLGRNLAMTHLDLSHNKLTGLPVEIYLLPLQVYINYVFISENVDVAYRRFW
jgi:leucine-rich repeat protein SHOC2